MNLWRVNDHLCPEAKYHLKVFLTVLLGDPKNSTLLLSLCKPLVDKLCLYVRVTTIGTVGKTKLL